MEKNHRSNSRQTPTDRKKNTLKDHERKSLFHTCVELQKNFQTHLSTGDCALTVLLLLCYRALSSSGGTAHAALAALAALALRPPRLQAQQQGQQVVRAATSI